MKIDLITFIYFCYFDEQRWVPKWNKKLWNDRFLNDWWKLQNMGVNGHVWDNGNIFDRACYQGLLANQQNQAATTKQQAHLNTINSHGLHVPTNLINWLWIWICFSGFFVDKNLFQASSIAFYTGNCHLIYCTCQIAGSRWNIILGWNRLLAGIELICTYLATLFHLYWMIWL